MKSITKRLSLILMVIMTYLPMTVVYAVPDVAIPEQTQSASEADKTNCCEGCCDIVYSSGSNSFVLAPSFDYVSINQTDLTPYTKLDFNIESQQPIPLLRPPISM